MRAAWPHLHHLESDSMSSSDPSLPAGGRDLSGRAARLDPPCPPLPSMGLPDAAIDRALRDVPLPDGLITRLGELVYRASDESADRWDWLGC
jgi:hypothetical protein